ncbi:hypothetical protein PTSG_10168 [Salpingoeca rosetta]|uniref:SH3 domain-containing protein n=1 Tax=Salpingoeca rosetta (strain ATCC 50818 / BSB-021) TaxID=946362 RepID=F2UQH9_SALR5|nr:uncharacterized protein PTSG_10168 [Salpingoeca rosetta]EGD79884.1 hypothetical protein PTSG_10168 [Salpingoeca rosetta]|eukprot:XP_004988505.1 hypothetical protein PTSG_10168 [Salpingoeca rosetta]
MYENVDDAANAIQRMSRLRQSQTQGDYVAPVDPVVPTAAPPPRPNRRPPPTINDTTPADKDADNAGDGGDDGDGVGDGNGGVRTATTHGPSTADGGDGNGGVRTATTHGPSTADGGVEMSKNDKAAAAAEAATTADEKSGDGDADSTSATETQKASAATDAGGDRAAQSDGDGDDDANPPAPPAPYKAEDEEQSESQSQPQSPADLVSPKMKKKRSWPNLFGRKQKAADSNEEAEFLSKVKGDSATMGVAIASKAVTKTKSTNYLTLAPNEKLDILEMKACPRGTWVCKNASGMIGFVMTTDVTLDAQSVRGFLDAIPKPQRAQVSAEGLPIETLSSSAGINVLPTEQCQIKAKQASEATQRLLGTPGGASDSDKAEGDGDGDGDGGGDGEDDGAEAKAESGEKEGEEASSDATATAAATEDEASGDKQTDSDQQKSSDEDTSEANTDSATDTTTKRAPSPGYDRLAFPAKGGSGSGGVNGDGGGDGDSEAIPEDTYAVPDELTGAEPSGLMYDDTPITAPGADDMYEAVTDALGSAPSTQPPPVPAPRKQSDVATCRL